MKSKSVTLVPVLVYFNVIMADQIDLKRKLVPTRSL